MRTWDKRPREIRNLFNPAFCGVVLLRSIEGYQEESGKPMPFSLTLVVPALSFHQQTREDLKSASKSYFVKIIEDSPRILVGLPDRIRGLFPYTMEAFGFLHSHGAITVTDEGGIALTDGAIRKSISGSPETVDCQKVARILGKKFAQINDRVTVFTTLGIRP